MEERNKNNSDEPRSYELPEWDSKGFEERWYMSEEQKRLNALKRKSSQQAPDYISSKKAAEIWQKREEPACFNRWADTAVQSILFSSDRNRIRAELYDHYLDRREVLLFQGMDESEADAQAVAMLGDPGETGRLLQRVHAPWLGVLLQAARVVLVLLVLVVVYLLIRGVTVQTTSRNAILRELDIIGDEDRCIEESLIARRVGTCTDELDFGPFHISCDSVSFQITHRKNKLEESDSYYDMDYETCAVLLRLNAAPWYEPDLPSIRVTDDSDREFHNGLAHNDYTPSFTIPSHWRELPWRTILAVKFENVPDDARWLDIYLEHKGSSNKLRIMLEPWQNVADELPRMGDVAESILTMTDRPDVYYHQVWSRNAETSEPQALKGLAISIPWARETFCEREPNLDFSTDLFPNERRRVECVLMVRGDVSEFPIPFHEKQWRVEILDPDADPEEQDLGRWYPEEAWYADGKLCLIYWYARPDTDRYLLRFTEPGGESCTLFINLEEKESLP